MILDAMGAFSLFPTKTETCSLFSNRWWTKTRNLLLTKQVNRT